MLKNNHIHPVQMASDALGIVSFKCVVKGYYDCHFDMKERKDFKTLKKIRKKGYLVFLFKL